MNFIIAARCALPPNKIALARPRGIYEMASSPLLPLLMSDSLPKITFGIIVLNGEPFTRFCIRSLYPHAHEILVAEGAAESARSLADAAGRSTDGTLEVLQDLKKNHDPDNKISIITKDGFWRDRDEQSRGSELSKTDDFGEKQSQTQFRRIGRERR